MKPFSTITGVLSGKKKDRLSHSWLVRFKDMKRGFTMENPSQKKNETSSIHTGDHPPHLGPDGKMDLEAQLRFWTTSWGIHSGPQVVHAMLKHYAGLTSGSNNSNKPVFRLVLDQMHQEYVETQEK